MKSFKLFIALLISVFIFDKIVYFALYQVDKKVFTGEGIGKINHFLKIKDTTKCIVFGNSRANHHVDPSVFGKSSFNIGVGGRKMAFSATLIQLLPQNTKQTVFLQIDPSYVFDYKYDGSDIKALVVKYHQNKIIKNKIDDIKMNNPFSSFFWCIDYNGKALSIISNKFRPKYDYTKYNGFDPVQNNEEQMKVFKKRLINLENEVCNENTIPSKLEVKYLKEIKKFCSENNKQLILFTSPVYKDVCPDDNIAMKKLMKKFGFDYYDFTNIYKGNTSLNEWKDEKHLSKIGAKRFSLFLGDFFKNKLPD